MRSPKKHLGFNSLLYGLTQGFEKIKDHRRLNSVAYSLADTLLGGFAMMYFQEPSLLQFQERQKEEVGICNLETIFGLKEIPKESQMRDIIDNVERENFRSIFKDFFERLQRGKHLSEYQLFPNLYLVGMDGSQYFCSEKIQCPACLEKRHKNGTVTYSHQILQGALMHPHQKVVLPFMPMEIRNEDGHLKQDCEVNAAKRFIEGLKKDHPRLGIILGGDGLFSKQPLIELARENNMQFIFVAKPDDHKVLMEWVDVRRAVGDMQTCIVTDETGKKHVYEWLNKVQLNGNKDTILVNYFKYQQILTDEKAQEKVTYQNSWVTDFKVTEQNIVTLVKGGRCRWKIENECFNTLKNQGYYIEHNYGHGEKNLSFNFLLLTLLAFYFHQIFELTDPIFQECRKRNGSKINLWNKLRAFIEHLLFESWYQLLDFILNRNKPWAIPKPP